MSRLSAVTLYVAITWFLGGLSSAAEVLPKSTSEFHGKIGNSRQESVPNWPQAITAPHGAPNIVLILLDDVGFAASSTFGGLTPTPVLDRLAAGGLRYNRFHVNAMCSPTRAALLSGRNSHQVGFGMIAESAAGYPGYNSVWPTSAASIAEVLKLNGYSTAAFGKWHNTPVWEVTPAGPYERWPIGKGFEYFYGFLGAATSQWEPALFRNTLPVEPKTTPREGYHLTTDLVNDAIDWVHRHDAVAQTKPFFIYFATGATHSPHQVPAEWIAKFKGQFDGGWDEIRKQSFARQKQLGVIPANAELTPRPKQIPSWEDQTSEQKKLLAHQAEVYAAFLAHTDHEIGRLLNSLKEDGHYEDTVVLYIIGDNGASAEGGFEGHDAVGPDGKSLSVTERLKKYDLLGSEYFSNHYATAWGWSFNAPFQWAKEVASHLGGTRNPLVVSWPGHIKDPGGFRSQFGHVNDIAPTIYELAHVQAPDVVNGVKQSPLEGTSLVYSINDAQAPSRHRIQYFEMLGSRGIYKDGWWAGSFNHLPWQGGGRSNSPNPEKNPWELYNLDQDYSQAHDVAAAHPEKLKELVQLFDVEAKRNNVYPLEPRRTRLPWVADGPSRFVYRSGVQRIPPATAPHLGGRAHVITADVEIPTKGAEGVIVAQGGRNGGFTLYIKNDRINYETNAFGYTSGSIVSSLPVPRGKVRIALEYKPDSTPDAPRALNGRTPVPGTATLIVNGVQAGEATVSALLGGAETFDIGADLGSPVSTKYATPFIFTGKVEIVTVEITADTAALVVPSTKTFTNPRIGNVLNSQNGPQVARRPLTITAEVVPQSADGVIVAQGGSINGYALYLQHGKLAFTVRENKEPVTIVAKKTPAGRLVIVAKLAADGAITLSIDGNRVADGHAGGLLPGQPQEDFCIGFDDKSPVGDYESENRFTGIIEKLEVRTALAP